MPNHYTITFGMRQAFCKMSVSMSGDHKEKIDNTGEVYNPIDTDGYNI